MTRTLAPDLSKARLRAWLRILKASNLVEKNIRERLRTAFDTTLPRFDVMAALHRNPQGMKMSRLSDVLKVSNGNVTGIIDRLVGDGFVVRVAVTGDRRANLVQLTDQGKDRFKVYAKAHEGWINEILGAIDGPDAETLTAVLGAISIPEEDR